MAIRSLRFRRLSSFPVAFRYPLEIWVFIFIISTMFLNLINNHPGAIHIERPPPIAVTIIIPNFNKAGYLPRSLGSACGQTLPNIEIIVADDGSSDNSVDVIQQFIDRDPRISFFVNNPQLLTNANRVKAVRRARGVFILTLDSDDELTNRTAEIDYRAAVTADSDIVEHRITIVENDTVKPYNTLNAPFRVANRKTLMKSFAAGRMNWTLWRKLIRRLMYLEAVAKMGEEACALKLRLCDDRLHCGMIFTVVTKFVSIDYVGYIYYWQVPGSATLTVTVRDEAPIVDRVLLKFYPSLATCIPANAP
jgi:glycosyltransferase involved in cell wall biosynthesis